MSYFVPDIFETSASSGPFRVPEMLTERAMPTSRLFLLSKRVKFAKFDTFSNTSDSILYFR